MISKKSLAGFSGLWNKKEKANERALGIIAVLELFPQLFEPQ
jgi:hypothetical protein